jgi:hypothetical protein
MCLLCSLTSGLLGETPEPKSEAVAFSSRPYNKPLKLTAASFGCAGAVLDTNRGSIMRGRSLAAIR